MILEKVKSWYLQGIIKRFPNKVIYSEGLVKTDVNLWMWKWRSWQIHSKIIHCNAQINIKVPPQEVHLIFCRFPWGCWILKHIHNTIRGRLRKSSCSGSWSSQNWTEIETQEQHSLWIDETKLGLCGRSAQHHVRNVKVMISRTLESLSWFFFVEANVRLICGSTKTWFLTGQCKRSVIWSIPAN